jgi:hypothetical protein
MVVGRPPISVVIPMPTNDPFRAAGRPPHGGAWREVSRRAQVVAVVAVVAPPLAARPLVGGKDPTAAALPTAGAGHRAPRLAKRCLEELDAGNPHVRIRGGLGKEAIRGYPTADLLHGADHCLIRLRAAGRQGTREPAISAWPVVGSSATGTTCPVIEATRLNAGWEIAVADLDWTSLRCGRTRRYGPCIQRAQSIPREVSVASVFHAPLAARRSALRARLAVCRSAFGARLDVRDSACDIKPAAASAALSTDGEQSEGRVTMRLHGQAASAPYSVPALMQ